MDISIFGFKLNVEILILIGIIYLIMVGHTVCGCCNYNLIEAFTDPSGNLSSGQIIQDLSGNIGSGQIIQDLSGNIPAPGGGAIANKIKGIVSQKEGFVGANTNYGESSSYNLNNNRPINTSSWFASDLTVVPGKTLSPGVQQILNRQPQPLPLPEGEMLLFANTPFKPECCPNTYSNSTGCACMTTSDYNYLVMRGGNNVPYSEY
jgi:hypothetical protein